jgi:predicted dinucleotide-binding enzyme
MRIAVLGAGSVGRTLGDHWSRAGHEVRYGSREPSGGANVGPHAEVAVWAEVVLLAVPGSGAVELVRSLGSALDGRTVIDATNRVGGATLHCLDAIGAAAPAARRNRAFSTVGWEVMAEPLIDGRRADLFYCGDEADRPVMERLIADTGSRPIRVGGLDEAETVDGVARLWFALALRQGLGRRLGFAVLGA